MTRIVAVAVVVAALAGAARAEEDSAAEAERKALEEQIAKELGQGAGAPARGPEAPAPAPAPAPAAGANPYARLLALPDLSAIGSFAVLWNDYDVGGRSPRSGPYAPRDALEFRFEELELGLQSVVDPYVRADVFIAFGPDAVSVEEAYVTTLALPDGLQLKAGRFFSPFGRLNGQHPHQREFVDAPLAHGRVLAAEVLSGPGVDVSWLAPLPWFVELHAAAQSTAPSEGDDARLTGVARLAQFFPLGEGTTLGVGLSAALRDEGGGALRQLGGADLYLRWRPPVGRSSLALQGELFGRRFTERGGGSDWSGYAQLVWQAGPRAGLGARYDQAPLPGAARDERRYGALAIWRFSEFQRLRLQLSHDVRPDGGTGVEALLQAEFSIGAHGAHPF